MKNLIALLISGALVVSGYAQTRNVLVGTNNAVVQPTNFWSADASNARAGLGLGSAATNPASAFQPSSVILSNLAVGGGSSLTNIAASNIIGTLSIGQGGTGSTNASDARTALGLGTAATNPATAFQASSANLTNLAANNGGALTNLTATSLVGVIPSSNISTVNFSNLGGTLSIASGGTGATNAANARQNLGSTAVGDALFITTNAAAARTTIGATTVGSSVFTLANPSAITFLRLNADNTATALSDSDFRTALSLGTAATNPASAFQPSSTVLSNLASSNAVNLTNIQATNIVGSISSSNISGVSFSNTIQSFTGDVADATNTAASSRNLTVYSIAPAVGGITNIVQLPTSNALAGDLANIIHTGPTSSLTAVRQVGGGTNLISYSNNNESIGFVYNGTNWAILPNNGFTFPIYFSGTNAAANAAASRTNLGLGWSALTNTNAATSLLGFTTNGQVIANTGTNVLTFTNDVKFGGGDLTVSGQSISGVVSLSFEDGSYVGTLYMDGGSIQFSGADNAATTRTNLGLGATWLTNTDVTNFRTAIGLGASNDVVHRTVQASVQIESSSFFVSDLGSIDFEDSGTINFGNAAPSVRTNLGLGLPALTNTNNANFRSAIGLGETNSPQFAALFLTNASAGSSTNYLLSLGLPTTGFSGAGAPVGAVNFNADGVRIWTASSNSGFEFPSARVSGPITFMYGGGNFGAIAFDGLDPATGAAVSRTNLGLPLPALTNTSNVTMMRALSGSTNTNHPYSGSISVTGTNNTNTLIFSNGILQSVTTP